MKFKIFTCFVPNLQGDVPPPSVPPPLESSTWAVKPAEKIKYDGIFEVSSFLHHLQGLSEFITSTNHNYDISSL